MHPARLDLITGQQSEQAIEIKTEGQFKHPFVPEMALNRAGLLLTKDGFVYIAFASPCDGGGNPHQPPEERKKKGDPHGWIFAYDTKQRQLYAQPTTISTRNAGVWQSGNGLAADENGYVYALTGNNSGEDDNKSFGDGQLLNYQVDPYSPYRTEFGESILKLHVEKGQFKGNDQLKIVDHFTAGNWWRLDTAERGFGQQPINQIVPNGSDSKTVVGADSDLGSGGPVLLPNGDILGGGKQGVLYVLNRTQMHPAKQGFQAFYNAWSYWIDPCEYDADQQYGPNIHGSLVVWHPEHTNYSYVYGMPEKDYLKAFRAFDDGGVSERPFLTTQDTGVRSPVGMPGGFLSLSANGSKNGILWASFPYAAADKGLVPGYFMAFDALTLQPLWSDDTNIVPFEKFVPPTIADGKVFRVADSEVLGDANMDYPTKILIYGSTGKASSPVSRPPTPLKHAVEAVWMPGSKNYHLDLFTLSGRSEPLATYTGLYLGNADAYQYDPGIGATLQTPQGTISACPTTWRGWYPVIDPQISSTGDGVNVPTGWFLTRVGF